MTSSTICLKGRVRIVNIDITSQNFQHSGPYKVYSAEKNKNPGGTDAQLSLNFFFASKAIFIKKIMVLLDGMWWFGTTLKTIVGCSIVDAGNILQLARHFGTWGTVLGPFESQIFYLNSPNPPCPLVNFFFNMHFRGKKCWTSRPMAHPPPPPTHLLPDLVPNKLTSELLWFLRSKIRREDSAKMYSLSLYGLFDQFLMAR